MRGVKLTVRSDHGRLNHSEPVAERLQYWRASVLGSIYEKKFWFPCNSLKRVRLSRADC